MLVWLLDLDIGGRRLHLSSNPVHYSGRFYSGTLDAVSFTDALDGVGDTPSDRTASLNAVLDTSLGTLLAQGHDFTTGRATLTLWHTDEPEHRALTVLRDAFVSQPEVGDEFEPVSFNITQRILDDTSSLLNDLAKVGPDTVAPNSTPGVGNDRYYPMLLGRPSGRIDAARPGSCAFGLGLGSPISDNNIDASGTFLTSITGGPGGLAQRLVVCGHHPGTSSPVAVYYAEGGGLVRMGSYDLYEDEDELGNTVYVAWNGSGVDPDREYFIKWAEDTQGVQNAGMSGYVNTTSRLLVHLASLSSLPYDVPSIVANTADLPGLVGWSVDEQVSASELLDEVISVLPLSPYNGPNGITLVRIDADRPVNRCTPLMEGLNAWREGPLRLTRMEDEAAGSISVRYGPIKGTDAYEGIVNVSQRPAQGLGQVANPWSITAKDNGSVNEIDLPWTYDEGTATFVATWLSRQAAQSPRIVSVRVGQELARSLTPGSPVAFTDSSVGLSEAVGIVTSREMTDLDFWTLELSFYPSTASLATETPSGASSVGTPVASGT